MSKTCQSHRCFKKWACRHKKFLGRLALCGLKKRGCGYRAALIFGRYEPEDIILP